MSDRIAKMERKISTYFCLLIAIFIFTSCRDNDDEFNQKEKQENVVTYKVSCNNPIAHINIWDGKDTPQIAIGTWETSFSTKGYATELTVTCPEDKKATIKIQIYVNNKFTREVSGYSPVELHYRLK